jgi:hypothetical protein
MFPKSNNRARFIAGVCGKLITIDEANIFQCLEQIAAPFIPPARECLVPLLPAYGFEKNRFNNDVEQSAQPIPVECRHPAPKPAGKVEPMETGPLPAGMAGAHGGCVVGPFVRSGRPDCRGIVLSSGRHPPPENPEKAHAGHAMDRSILVSAHPPILMKTPVATLPRRSVKSLEVRYEMCWLIRVDSAS